MSTQLASDSSLEFFALPVPDRAAESAPAAGAAPPARVDLASDEPLPELAKGSGPSPSAAPGPATCPAAKETFWLDGDALMCACPDCRAPMSVRLWLMAADCWRCGTSIELTEEQEREALRLLRRRDAARGSVPAPADEAPSSRAGTPPPRAPQSPSAPAVAPAGGSMGRTPPPRKPPGGSSPSPSEASFRTSAETPIAASEPASAGGASASPQRLAAAYNEPRRRLARHLTPGLWLLRLLKDSPAWLTSLLIHLIVLLILALLTPPREDNANYIRLNAIVSADMRRSGQEEIVNPADTVRFDLPLPDQLDLRDRRTRETAIRADQQARELRLVDPADPNLPDIAQLKLEIGRADGSAMSIAARDPRVRVELLTREGGTTLTEAAVARGLRWLAQQQQADGRWRLDGSMDSDSAGTSLALLPFLGAGQTHLSGRHREAVARGLRWLVGQQKPDGDLRAGATNNSGMYAHGQGAIVLCEAYLMTGDEALRQPAQQAIDFIVQAQYPDGGWRYQPAREVPVSVRRGDTSIVGWQLMALQSARAARLRVPAETFELASHFLDSVQHRDGAVYGYQPGQQPTPTMTAEALLGRVYLGWTKADPPLLEGVRYLLDEHAPSEDRPNVYYWYYGTQTLHHVGGAEWERWNFRMRDVLVNSQETRGEAAGSWAPRGEFAAVGGRLYMTALAVCSLEVYYRHLPIFRQIEMK